MPGLGRVGQNTLGSGQISGRVLTRPIPTHLNRSSIPRKWLEAYRHQEVHENLIKVVHEDLINDKINFSAITSFPPSTLLIVLSILKVRHMYFKLGLLGVLKLASALCTILIILLTFLGKSCNTHMLYASGGYYS